MIIFFTSFSCNLPMAPLIFAEKANFGFFLSGAGNFIIDTFLKENDVVIWVGWAIINHSNLFNVSSWTRSSYSRIRSSSSAISEI